MCSQRWLSKGGALYREAIQALGNAEMGDMLWGGWVVEKLLLKWTVSCASYIVVLLLRVAVWCIGELMAFYLAVFRLRPAVHHSILLCCVVQWSHANMGSLNPYVSDLFPFPFTEVEMRTTRRW